MAEEMRIVLRNVGKIDPLKIDEYISAGGYKSLGFYSLLGAGVGNCIV